MKRRNSILLALLLIFLVMQAFQPAKNQSTTKLPTDITNVVKVPQDVQSVLAKSCYDCHSNNTVYPWYSNIQPAAWFLADHIKDGKRHLNFSEFGSYPLDKKLKKLKEIAEEVEEDEMPISSYTLIHRNTTLTPEEKVLLTTWVKSISLADLQKNGVSSAL